MFYETVDRKLLDKEVKCLVCTLMKGKNYGYDDGYIVEVEVDHNVETLYIEGTYGEVFVVVHEYMNGRDYKYKSIYYYYYGCTKGSMIKDKLPNEFMLSLLEYVNINNAGVIASLIEGVDNDIENEEQLLEYEKRYNGSYDKSLYDYEVIDGNPVLTIAGIKKKCMYLRSYILIEALNIYISWQRCLYSIQDMIKESTNIDDLLYLTAKMHYYVRHDVSYPYIYYKMVIDGKFDELRLVGGVYI